MKQKFYLLFTLFLGLQVNSQSNSFVASTCIGTTTGPQSRMYTPAIADYDGDNDKDIIVCDESGLYFLYTNNGSNTFTSTNILSGLSSWTKIESKDIDNDGDIDVVSVTGKIFINNGSAVFTQLPGTFYTATGAISNFKIADFNGDGKQDVLWLNGTQNSATNKNQLWINSGTTGNANFTLASEFDNLGIYVNNGAAFGDIDNDGDLDLTITGTGGWVGKVYKNNGSGVFTSSQSFTTYTGFGFLVDWDKDGDLDFLAYDNYNNFGLHLWKNDGTGLFGTVSPSSLVNFGASNLYLVDLNGDTWSDIVYTNLLDKTTKYVLNSGCQLTNNSQVLSTSWNGVAISDFNNDGKPDVFNAARDAQSCIYLNDLNVQPYVAITTPVVSSPQNYIVGQNAPLTATGNNLLWYTASTGGTGSGTAPTPNTTTVGTTSYWVSNTNINGCESQRVEVVVNVSAPATHLNFDGVNDRIVLSNESNFDFTNQMTAEFWMNSNVIPEFWDALVVKGDTSWRVALTSTGTIAFAGTNAFTDFLSTTSVTDGNWHHVAVTYDGANAKIYIDGSLESQVAGTANINNSSYPVSLGENLQMPGRYYTGNMDEVRLWNVARTAEQIAASRSCELQGNEMGLVAYYKFNQGFDAANNTGITTLTDATANANNGTLTNFALNGSISNWLAGSPITTGSIIPSSPSVTTPIAYNQGASASPLTATVGANGTGLMWYTVAIGGAGSTTAPTPSTATAGTTSYWVASTNANGCESERVEIVVNVNAAATHLNFDGVNDYVAIGNIIPNASSYTKEAWVFNEANTGARNIVSSQNNPFWINNGILLAGNNNNYAVVQDVSIFPLNTWTHVAVTYDAPTTTMKLYKNGVLVTTNIVAPPFVAENSFIGSHFGTTSYFLGSIDEVRIWNYALNQADIQATMNCEAQAQPELIAYYKFNQGFDNADNTAITTLTDAVGSSHGTLMNMTRTGAVSNFKSGSPITTGTTCATLSTSEFEAISSLKVYPNPSTGIFTIATQEDVTVEVYDLVGKAIVKQTMTVGSNSIDISNYASGMYLLKATNASGKTNTYKIVKQ